MRMRQEARGNYLIAKYGEPEHVKTLRVLDEFCVLPMSLFGGDGTCTTQKAHLPPSWKRHPLPHRAAQSFLTNLYGPPRKSSH